MSSQYEDYDETPEEAQDSEAPAQQAPADLRAAAKRGAKAAAEAEALRRENAFLKAGIDPDDSRLRYFVKGYDGDLSPAQIRQAAVEAGFIADPQQAQQAEAQQVAFGSQQRVMQAAAGAYAESSSEAAILAQLEQAFSEGGVPAMLDVARSYGVPVTYDGLP